MAKATTEQEFGKVRSLLWPIHNYELKKLIPMAIMAFFISFNYTVVRDTKDALIMTSAGAETLPWLKTIGTVPGAIIFMIIYLKLSNVLSREKLFYAAMVPFLVFFALFPMVIYPYREAIQPNSAPWLESVLPLGWHGLIGMYKNWTYSLFYIMAELWGSAVLSLMFWGFANQITRTTEAKRFYSLFGIAFNVALTISGPMVQYYSGGGMTVAPGVDAGQVMLNYLMTVFVLAALTIIVTYWWMNRYVLPDPRFYDPNEVKKEKKKLTMSVGEAVKFILGSPYLLCLAVLVMAYGISINLIEVTWKDQVRLQYPTKNEYNYFMGGFSGATGWVTIFMSLFVGGNLIRRMGWRFSALFTPVVLGVTSLGFFAFVIFKEDLSGLASTLGTTPLMMAVMFGYVQNIMSKSSKYTLFDPTKEMSYIPLDSESKVKGKAAVDVVVARLGKGGGAAIWIFLLAFGSISQLLPIVATITMGIVVAWIVAVVALNKLYLEACKKKDIELAAEAAATA